MRTNPFYDTWLFLIGQQPDQLALGPWRWLVVALFLGLLAASAWIARENWRRDPAQRNAADVTIWLFRVLMGAMWFQGSLWKLPLPVSGGFEYWTGQIAEHAAFAFHRDFAREVLLPNIGLLQTVTVLSEMSFAVSLILGVAVRLFSLLGTLFALQLWLGLYRHPDEWPWQYLFIAFTLGQFAIYGAGRSLGLDALLLHRTATRPQGVFGRVFGRVYTLVA
ncbi:MAG TPA: hypothetical protein VE684_04565 [Crenalkalicoccus sp.]|jgi:uncharacterized membrane protein YphA (DoxX/SURF4 family)|nr:hypothetical protein [Crenalkalicoccus sp.]